MSANGGPSGHSVTGLADQGTAILLQVALHRALQWPCAIHRVVAAVGEPGQSGVVEVQRQAAVGQQAAMHGASHRHHGSHRPRRLRVAICDTTFTGAPIDAEVQAEIEDAVAFANASPPPDPADAYTDIQTTGAGPWH